jgi:hypothetical protein
LDIGSSNLLGRGRHGCTRKIPDRTDGSETRRGRRFTENAEPIV